MNLAAPYAFAARERESVPFGERCGAVEKSTCFQVWVFRIQGLGFRVQGAGFRVQGVGLHRGAVVILLGEAGERDVERHVLLVRRQIPRRNVGREPREGVGACVLRLGFRV